MLARFFTSLSLTLDLNCLSPIFVPQVVLLSPKAITVDFGFSQEFLFLFEFSQQDYSLEPIFLYFIKHHQKFPASLVVLTPSNLLSLSSNTISSLDFYLYIG